MSRALLVLALATRNAAGQNLPLPPILYDYDALEPHMDEATMRVHHLKHHQTYTDKINGALTKLRSVPEHKYLAKMGIDTLLSHLDEVPEAIRSVVRNAGGGYVNHDFFFRSMAPDGGGEPMHAALVAAIQKNFGTVSSLKQMFSLAALEVFGSGWAWLVRESKSGALKITSTANQDTPLMQAGLVPLLGLDVWEHAYYLKHQSNRKGYIEAFWEVVDWSEVGKRFDAAGDASKTEL